MNVIVDTDVILDVLLAREPFLADSAEVVDKAVLSEYAGYICATTVTNIYYIARKSLGPEKSLKAITDLISIFAVAPVNRSVISDALTSKFTDFEDAVLNYSGKAVGAQYIVTRNGGDYSHSDLTIYDPNQFLKAMSSG